MRENTSFLTLHDDHIRISIRLTPASRQNVIDGPETDASGQSWLKVRVNAQPEKGKANAALIGFLAQKLKLPKGDIIILAGDTQRKKILRIKGNPEDLAEKITTL